MKHSNPTQPTALSAVTTRALKTPFAPRLKFALATGLVVLAAGLSLSPAARAMAGAGDHAGHGQHQAGQHHGGQHHARHQGMHGGGMGMGMEMGGMGMGMGMGHGRHADKLLDSVGATAEQKAQIRQIGEAARTDIQARREAGAGLREQARTLMAQPTIDAAAVEALRQQMLAQHDQTSQRMTQAMVEMARVLTPDQRQALAQRMSERMSERMNKRQEMMKQHRAEHLAAPAAR